MKLLEDTINSEFHSAQVTDFSTLKISIVIPAYNEESRIESTIKEIVKNIPEIEEVIVVFDGSDNTPAVAKSVSEKVRVLKFDKRLGHGGAIFEGYKAAKYDIVCSIDADGSVSSSDVKKACYMIDKDVPVVIGSRWVKDSNIIRKKGVFDAFASRIYHYLSFAILGIKEKDPLCGLKAYRREISNEIAKRIIIRDRTFNVAILYHLKLMGIYVKEFGVTFDHKDGSKLPNNLKFYLMMFMSLVGLRLMHSNSLTHFRNGIIQFRKSIKFY